ncbi:MAG TPA: surface-adhesin E family protein [Pyrinomonadaceae bacterium]|nr:surface-adhesin E family protein [Pyrinomonadaceae bacterium]
MRKLLGVAVIIIIAVLPALSQSRWVQFSQTKDEIYYYDKETIRKRRDGTISAWGKTAPRNEEIRQRLIREKNAKGREDYSKYSHTVVLWYLSCNDRKYKLVTFTDYDDEGGVILSDSSNDNRWDDAPPGTIIERLFKEICGD